MSEKLKIGKNVEKNCRRSCGPQAVERFDARGGAQGSPQKRHGDFGYNFSSLCDNVTFWDVCTNKNKDGKGEVLERRLS